MIRIVGAHCPTKFRRLAAGEHQRGRRGHRGEREAHEHERGDARSPARRSRWRVLVFMCVLLAGGAERWRRRSPCGPAGAPGGGRPCARAQPCLGARRRDRGMVARRDGPARRALALRPLARLPHRLRGGRRGDAALHGARRVALAADAATPDYLELAQALGEGHRHPLRGRRGVGHGASRSSSGCSGRGSWSSPGRSSGMPFSLEGFAFFTEAIFLGIYLYGWERVAPRAAPRERRAGGGERRGVGVLRHPGERLDERARRLRARRRRRRWTSTRSRRCSRPGWAHEVVHVLLSCYSATGFAVAGHPRLRAAPRPGERVPPRRAPDRARRRRVAALLQPLSGDFSARQVAATQPVKLAALEGQFETERGAPLRIGGLPGRGGARRRRYALEIPRGLSLLAFHDPDAEVKGLDRLPARRLAERARTSTSRSR